MKKLLLLLLLFFLPSLGNSSTLDFSDLTPEFNPRGVAIDVDGFEIFVPTISSFTPIVSTDPDIYKFKLFASQLPPELELVVVYLSFEERDRMWNGEEPTFAEVVQITTISNDGEDVPYSFFEKDVENSISMLLKAEEALEPALAEITKQEAKVSSGVAEDKTIRVLMPSGPFIYEDNALSYTFIDFTHQTKDNQITETGRLITTLIIFFENRFINVGFYKTTSQESTADDLASEKEKAKDWYKDFLRIQDTNDLIWKGYEAINKKQYDLARSIFLPLADQGDNSALYGMYHTYESQCKFPCQSPMLDQKIYWLTKIAEQGHLDALYELGLLYLTKKSLNDYQTAFNIFLSLAEKGDAKAQERLGFMYEINAIGEDEKNDEKVLYWYTKAAEQGHGEAAQKLGSAYHYGFNGVLKDEEKSYYWYKIGAEAGNLESQRMYSFSFSCGPNDVQGCDQRIYWLTKCTEKGYYLCPDALDRARQWAAAESNTLQDGLNAYDKGDFKKAIPILLPFADSGKIEAQKALGHIYFHKGELKDDMQAMRWFYRAAEKGHKPSSEMLPVLADNLIADGYDAYEKKDYQTVLDLWLPLAKASMNGKVHQISWVQYDLGMLFYKGEIVQRDYEQAANMFKKSAEQGFVDSQFALGILYINGEGVMKSYKKAADWINKANENGHERAEEVWNKYELWNYE
jgi:TPR repeat protein